MCRNIRVLHYFAPPTTHEEVRAAAIQYVRKVSGMVKPNAEAEAAFEAAVAQIEAATLQLLGKLPKKGAPKTRDGEKEKAKAKWEKRAERMRAS
jgi:hypothetical protein